MIVGSESLAIAVTYPNLVFNLSGLKKSFDLLLLVE